MKMRVSDYIAGYLEQLGIKKVFLLSGGGMMHLLDAISRREHIGYLSNHHEQASAMAAESYARVAGHLGVCYATSGPGGSNTVTGIIGAWQDSSPLLVITGQSKLSQTIMQANLPELRQFGTFEVNIVPIVKSITKYAVFLDDPNRIRYHLEKACALAVHGRPGPVLIDIPVDLQGAIIDPDALIGFNSEELSFCTVLDPAIIEDVLQKIKQAKKPLILAGHGIRAAGAAALFESVIDQLNVPIITTPLAKDLLPYDHSLFVGHPGVKGDRPGNFAVQTADLILVIGSSLHVTTTGYELDQFAPNAYKIQIEPDQNILQREQLAVEQKIQIDINIFLNQVHAHLANTQGQLIPSSEWHQRCQLWKHDLSVSKERHVQQTDRINYYEFMNVLSELCQGGEVITTDAGSAYYVVGQAFKAKKGQRVINSGALGTMGFAVPAATGASIAAPNATIICITGDGSLQTNIHELAVIQHNQLNIKLFILNNHGYVSIRNTQTNYFSKQFAGVDKDSGVSFPDLSLLAKAYSLPYYSAETVNDLESTIKQVLSSKGPVLCEIFASVEQEIIPTVSSAKMPDGKMVSKPLQDMFPFLDEKEIKTLLTFSE